LAICRPLTPAARACWLVITPLWRDSTCKQGPGNFLVMPMQYPRQV
jgi:hypothetical protein